MYINLQTHHVDSTLKQRGNDRFHVVSTWNPRGELVGKRVHVKFFSGATINQLNYYVVPVLVDEKPNNALIHIGSYNITKFNYKNVNAEEFAHRIINIGLICRSYGVTNIAVSSTLKRNIFNINQVIYQINNILKRLCRYMISFRYVTI